MNYRLIAALFLFMTAAIHADPVRVMRREGGGGGGEGKGSSVVTPRVDRTPNVSRTTPTRVTRRPYSPARHDTVVHNRTVLQNINRQRRVEVVPNRYYWHTVKGVRYAHTYRHGVQWYGFYRGPRFYWSRYYGNNWWWYDTTYARWSFWANGYWWWPGPGNVMYVYVNDNYYPYATSDVPVEEPTNIPAAPADVKADTTTSTNTQNSVLKSPEGQRTVQIVGVQSDAFLYDNTRTPPVFLQTLGSNATNVRFSGGTNGQPLQILVDYSDGHFALFGENGESIQSSASAPAASPEASDSEDPPIPPPGLN